MGYLSCNAIHSEILRRDDVAFQTCKDSSKNMSKKALYIHSSIQVPCNIHGLEYLMDKDLEENKKVC